MWGRCAISFIKIILKSLTDRRVYPDGLRRRSRRPDPAGILRPCPSKYIHTYAHLETEPQRLLNFNHKNALHIVPTVGGSENDEGVRRRLLLADGYVAERGKKGAKGCSDVRVETTGRIERNGDPRKRKKETPIEGVTVDRRTATARNDEDGEWCTRARMDCSIVKCTKATLRKKKKYAIVSLTHGVVSRRSRHGLPEKFRRLFSRSSRDTPDPPFSIRYAFRQYTKLPTLKAPSRFRRRATALHCDINIR